MARIKTYQDDGNISGSDKVLGTNSVGNTTRNYQLKYIARWMNINGQITVVGQSNYIFNSDFLVGRTDGSVTFEGFGGDNTPFADITELVFSGVTTSGADNLGIWDAFVGKKIVLARLDAQSNYGIYTLDGFDPHPTEPGYYVAALSVIQASGNIKNEEAIGTGLYSGAVDDKHYMHTQTVSSPVWTINHNLGKRPSVSVVDSTDASVMGEVVYIDENTLSITFKSAFKGKAYLN